MSGWTDHVKRVAKAKGISYGEAMPVAAKTWRGSSKVHGGSRMGAASAWGQADGTTEYSDYDAKSGRVHRWVENPARLMWRVFTDADGTVNEKSLIAFGSKIPGTKDHRIWEIRKRRDGKVDLYVDPLGTDDNECLHKGVTLAKAKATATAAEAMYVDADKRAGAKRAGAKRATSSKSDRTDYSKKPVKAAKEIRAALREIPFFSKESYKLKYSKNGRAILVTCTSDVSAAMVKRASKALESEGYLAHRESPRTPRNQFEIQPY